jgi:hypothetical protein
MHLLLHPTSCLAAASVPLLLCIAFLFTKTSHHIPPHLLCRSMQAA